MPLESTRASAEEWARHSGLKLELADAIECGWSKEAAESFFAELIPGRSSATAGEIRALLDERGGSPRTENHDGASRGPDMRASFPRMAEEMLRYRIEREQIVARYHPIRFTRVNLKLVASEMPADVLRALAGDLGWSLREDEEGVTVAVEDLLPYFRRPIVRRLLDAKFARAGLEAH